MFQRTTSDSACEYCPCSARVFSLGLCCLSLKPLMGGFTVQKIEIYCNCFKFSATHLNLALQGGCYEKKKNIFYPTHVQRVWRLIPRWKMSIKVFCGKLWLVSVATLGCSVFSPLSLVFSPRVLFLLRLGKVWSFIPSASESWTGSTQL